MLLCVVCLSLPDRFGDSIKRASFILNGQSVCGDHVEALAAGGNLTRTVAWIEVKERINARRVKDS